LPQEGREPTRRACECSGSGKMDSDADYGDLEHYVDKDST
jgi:hypothetical protein